MQSVSQLLGGQAAPRILDHNGRRYSCRALTQEVKSEIERRLDECRRSSLIGPRPDLVPVPVLTALLKQHSDEVMAGDFAFGGPRHAAWLMTAEGMVVTTAVMFQTTDLEATTLLLERGVEVGHLIQLTILESLPPAQAAALRAALAAQVEETSGEPVPNE